MSGGSRRATFIAPAIAIAVLAGVLGGSIATTDASHIDFEQRRAEREAEREARRAEREARRAEREAEEQTEESAEDEPQCSCRASLKFDRPALRFGSDGVLRFFPRVNVNIRTRGDHDAPLWAGTVAFEGTAAYASDDVTVPADQSFSGNQALNNGNELPCGSTLRHNGLELGAISLTGITSSLVGLDQELDGNIGMTAQLAIPACQVEEEESRQFRFTLADLLNLKVRGWRSLR